VIRDPDNPRRAKEMENVERKKKETTERAK